MKKRYLKIVGIIFTIILLITMAACGGQNENKNKNELTLETFKKSFEEAGVVLKDENVPMFSLIRAKDGILFYNGSEVVKIYEYESESALKEAVDENSMMSSWPQNGKFVLETNNEQAIEIFNNVK